MLRIGAALALLILSVNWIGVLIIAVLLVLYELGLHRLHQTRPRPKSARAYAAANGDAVCRALICVSGVTHLMRLT
jgi:hypothetical protein